MLIDNKYTVLYTIPPSCIDGKCRYTALSMAVMAQDLAAWHYTAAGLSIPHLQKMNLTWIITKQHFEIFNYPLWMDSFFAQTWAQEPKGPFCFRDFAYFYTENGKKSSVNEAVREQNTPAYLENLQVNLDAFKKRGSLFMRGSSCWMLLHTETGQVVKPEPQVFGSLQFNNSCMEGKVFAKIALPKKWDIEETVTPSVLDIDLNAHVNNLTYLRWILSAMNADFCRTRLLRTIDTAFTGSAKYGEKLIVRAACTETDTVIHSIIRQADKSEVFKARTVWADEKILSRGFKID